MAQVQLDAHAAEVIAVMRPELEEYQCVEPGDDEELPLMVWFSPEERPIVVVHADRFRLGTVEDTTLYDLVISVFDPRRPRHCHTEGWLTPSNQVMVRYANVM